jgi:tyrosyl-tRNA synthetase
VMWRYYELLTDRSLAEIAAMKQTMHPMEAKIALGKLIVADFHSAAEAECAAEVFNRVVRHGEVPTDILKIHMHEGVRVSGLHIRVDKLLAKSGMADSVNDAVRKIKAGAVEINGQTVKDLMLTTHDKVFVIRVGKKWLQVVG